MAIVPQSKFYLVCPGMFGNVVQGFLRNPVESHFDVGRDLDVAFNFQLDGDARPACKRLAQLAQ